MDDMICAGIVTYNPDINRLDENITAIINQVDEVVIFDNGSSNYDSILNLKKKFQKPIQLLRSKQNIGIASALNKIFIYASSAKYSWVLTLDQDSVCPLDMVKILLNCPANTGISCPAIYDINKKNNICNYNNSIIKIERCITSGSLTRIEAWKKVDGFDDVMFIDGVDFDFCDRIRKAGFIIIQNKNTVLHHEIGSITSHKIFGVKVNVKNHGPFRKYYIAKNIIYLDKKNKVALFPFKAILRVLKQLALVILFEDNKIKKINSIIRGMIAGFKEKVK